MKPNYTKTYWNSKGRYQKISKALEALVPAEGEVPDATGAGKSLDAYRRAVNCYYDLYNNGLSNRAEEFREIFGCSGTRFTQDTVDRTDEKMDAIVLAAAWEQKLIEIKLKESVTA